MQLPWPQVHILCPFLTEPQHKNCAHKRMGRSWIVHRWKPGKIHNFGSKRWVLPPPSCDFTSSGRGKSILHHIICWEENISHPNKCPRQGDDNTVYNGDYHYWESQTKRMDETFSVCSKAAPIFVTIQSQCAFSKWQTGKREHCKFWEGDWWTDALQLWSKRK